MWVDELGKILFQTPSRPSYAQLELNNACNLDCAMCPRHELPIKLQEMPLEVFEKVVDQLSRLGQTQIDMGGWGEVTFHSKFADMVAYANSRGMKISLTTNGLLLRGEKMQILLDQGVKDITFSIDSLEKRKKDFTGHINSPAIRNLIELAKYKESHSLNLRINTLVQKSNAHEVLELLDEMDQIGVDMVVLFGPNIARDGANFRLPFDKEQALYDEIDQFKAVGRWKCVVTTPPGRYKKGLRKYHYGLGKYCPQTYQSFYINLQGKITPCTLLPALELGDPKDFESLDELWNSPGFKAFRRDQVEICKGCDALKFEAHCAS